MTYLSPGQDVELSVKHRCGILHESVLQLRTIRTVWLDRRSSVASIIADWFLRLSASQIRPKEDQDGILASLSAADLEKSLDIRPFMQRHP